jgi:hypothetical protein
MGRDAQLREALRCATADALEQARAVVRITEEQMHASAQLSAQLRETTLRLKAERRRRQVAAHNRATVREE